MSLDFNDDIYFKCISEVLISDVSMKYLKKKIHLYIVEDD